MSTRIVFNGQEFHSLDDMPPEVRHLYDKAMAALGKAPLGDIDETTPLLGKVLQVQHTTITVNGTSYESVDAMPADVRRIYETAMSAAAGQQSPAAHVPAGARAGALPSPAVKSFYQTEERAERKARNVFSWALIGIGVIVTVLWLVMANR